MADQDHHGDSVIHIAARNGRLNVIEQLLMEEDVAIDLQDKGDYLRDPLVAHLVFVCHPRKRPQRHNETHQICFSAHAPKRATRP